MFIAFEANEGAGKTSQARRLFETLEAQGRQVVLTREPGGSPMAEQIRNLVVCGAPDSMDAETELLLFTAARRDHLARTVRPALARGAIVICDRYLGSTYALQGAAGVPEAHITTLFDTFCGLRPDLTVFLDIDLATAFARRGVALDDTPGAEARFERKGLEFHREIDRRFRLQAAADPTWITVDATGDMDTVADRVARSVAERLTAPSN